MATDQITMGQVKWFNNHSGYGFITAIDGEQRGKDIFVHHSAIHATDAPYKFLMEGEYIEFALAASTTGNHEFQATQVTGIKGGSLMCQRQSNRRPDHDSRPVNRGRNPNRSRRGGDE